jgi:NAD(P)-dependent dehydrogenase (short-subunit alcohol dehydrogenase family)
MFDDLAGKAVLITGAGSGIGAAVAKGFSGARLPSISTRASSTRALFIPRSWQEAAPRF